VHACDRPLGGSRIIEPTKLPSEGWRDHYEVVLARAKQIVKDVELRLRSLMGEDEMLADSAEPVSERPAAYRAFSAERFEIEEDHEPDQQITRLNGG
jgi:hypothetical protein